MIILSLLFGAIEISESTQIPAKTKEELETKFVIRLLIFQNLDVDLSHFFMGHIVQKYNTPNNWRVLEAIRKFTEEPSYYRVLNPNNWDIALDYPVEGPIIDMIEKTAEKLLAKGGNLEQVPTREIIYTIQTWNFQNPKNILSIPHFITFMKIIFADIAKAVLADHPNKSPKEIIDETKILFKIYLENYEVLFYSILRQTSSDPKLQNAALDWELETINEAIDDTNAQVVELLKTSNALLRTAGSEEESPEAAIQERELLIKKMDDLQRHLIELQRQKAQTLGSLD